MNPILQTIKTAERILVTAHEGKLAFEKRDSAAADAKRRRA